MTDTPAGAIQPVAPEPIGFDKWSTQIPTELKDKGYWEPVKDQPLSTVLKNYGHAQERMGKSIVVPEPADKEAWSKVFSKLGRPDDPTGYDYNLPEHKTIKWNPDMFKELNTTMHNLGATKEQVKGLVEWFTKDVITKQDAAQDAALAAADAAQAKFKKEFGTNFEANMAFGRRAAEMYFGPEFGKEFLDANMNDERIVRGMVKLGMQLAEDGAFGKKPVEYEGAISKEAAKTKINEVMSNRAHPYWSTTDSDARKAAYAEMENLHKIAFPE